jgi:hypothetical protein
MPRRSSKLDVAQNALRVVEEVPAEFGNPSPKNAALMLGAEGFEIEFALGQSVELSLRQFIDILNRS